MGINLMVNFFPISSFLRASTDTSPAPFALSFSSVFNPKGVNFIKRVPVFTVCFSFINCAYVVAVFIQNIFSVCNHAHMKWIATPSIFTQMIYNKTFNVLAEKPHHKPMGPHLLGIITGLPIAVFVKRLLPIPTAIGGECYITKKLIEIVGVGFLFYHMVTYHILSLNTKIKGE